jgi:hypothetical protein
MELIETPEYEAGRAWAEKNENRLVERYSNDDIIGGSLRTHLFEEAAKLYPATGGDLENDLKQTRWVVGAFRHVTETLPLTPAAMRAVFDAAQELGAIYGAEASKLECFQGLKAKPAAWWRKKVGDASPNDVVDAATVGWRIKRRQERQPRVEPMSKWEVLVDAFGSREMCALLQAERIELVKDGHYWYYWVHAHENGFQMIMRPVMHEGRMTQAPGDLIG